MNIFEKITWARQELEQWARFAHEHRLGQYDEAIASQTKALREQIVRWVEEAGKTQ